MTQLTLHNFRNYARLSLDLPRRTTILQGHNAQGKTNLLEAIYYLVAARSPYASTDAQLVNWLAEQDDLPYARITAELARGDTLARIEITLMPNGNGPGAYRKHIRLNGVPKRAMDLLGQVNVVLFVPQDIVLIDGSPSGRRRYLDAMLCQIDPAYCRALTQYNRVLERRNALLRSLREQGGAADQLDFWDEMLVDHGSVVIARRQQAIVNLEALSQPVHDELSGGRERLRLRYLPSFDPQHKESDRRQLSLNLELAPPISLPQPSEAIRPVFARLLDAARREEIQRGMTALGPHRDEFRFYDGQIDLHAFGSRGQQRTAVLAIKLAELDLMARASGEQPILLLDDVMSELDVERRRYLCGQLGRVEQAVITTTDAGDLTEELLESAALFRVSAGHLQQDK
ncbi:MAG: DNA replication/repair protein RecF [Anaerolineae bacterium]|nr:DNA replication/repair protein RecF [Anaerolineae bacterium]